jgi:hypothetical protein
MSWQTILGSFFLTLVYGAIVVGLAWLLRRAGVAARRAVALGFVIFGLASGLLSAWAWPYDSCVLPNLWAVLLGDGLYQWASGIGGNAALLRVPWIYPLAGAMLYGALGLAVQVIANGWWARRMKGGKGRSIRA